MADKWAADWLLPDGPFGPQGHPPRGRDVLSPPDLPLRALTPAELRTLKEDGVVCAKGILPPAWVDRLRAAVDFQSKHPNKYTGRAPPRVATCTFAWFLNDDFRDGALYSPAPLIARQALNAMGVDKGDSKRVRFFYDQMFVKFPGAPQGPDSGTAWHHDITFWPVEGEEVVSLWFPFDKVDMENGGLEYVRGSHKWGHRYKAYGVGATFPSDTLKELPRIRSRTSGDSADLDPNIVTFTTEPGDCILHHPLTLHGAPANRSSRGRRALAFRYFGDGVSFNDANDGPNSVAMPLLWEHGLRNGQPLSGPVFPQVLPELLRGEVAARSRGVVLPSKPMWDSYVATMVKAKRATSKLGREKWPGAADPKTKAKM